MTLKAIHQRIINQNILFLNERILITTLIKINQYSILTKVNLLNLPALFAKRAKTANERKAPLANQLAAQRS